MLIQQLTEIDVFKSNKLVKKLYYHKKCCINKHSQLYWIEMLSYHIIIINITL